MHSLARVVTPPDHSSPYPAYSGSRLRNSVSSVDYEPSCRGM